MATGRTEHQDDEVGVGLDLREQWVGLVGPGGGAADDGVDGHSEALLGAIRGAVGGVVDRGADDQDVQLWRRHLQQIGPMTAGLGVLAAWSAAALLVGGLSLRLRDG